LKEARSGRLWEMGDKVALKKYLKKIGIKVAGKEILCIFAARFSKRLNLGKVFRKKFFEIMQQ
jgi:hypothetical protein